MAQRSIPSVSTQEYLITDWALPGIDPQTPRHRGFPEHPPMAAVVRATTLEEREPTTAFAVGVTSAHSSHFVHPSWADGPKHDQRFPGFLSDI